MDLASHKPLFVLRNIALFMVKKEVFEWIRIGQRTIELRRGKVTYGDGAVF